jgi:hypothetical protein
MARRSYGSGSLVVRADANGAETWYGLWRTGTRRVKRALGPKRTAGSRDGLTRKQAEGEREGPVAKRAGRLARWPNPRPRPSFELCLVGAARAARQTPEALPLKAP